MKKSYPLLSLLFIFVMSLHSLVAQNQNNKLQFGIAANSVLSIKSWSSYRTGISSEFQLWLKKPIRKKQSLTYILGYRQLTGFQMRSIRIQERHYPDQFQTDIQTTNVTGLNYLDMSVNWQYQLGHNSPFSLGVGLRWSYMTHWNASEQHISWESNFRPRIEENSFSGVNENSIVVNESIPLPSNAFNRHNIGILLHLGYDLTSGLQLTTSYAHGLNQVFQDWLFPQHKSYRIATFSIGLAARLY